LTAVANSCFESARGKRRARIATILVIDDEAEVRQTLARMLAGHAVHEAADGGAGLALAAELAPDLVVTDILMPEKEGIETIRELRRAHPRVRILAISGGGQSGTLDFLDMARALGADAALAKPFRRSELLEMVERLLGD
jgi:CheY-like chemotaxis protein